MFDLHTDDVPRACWKELRSLSEPLANHLDIKPTVHEWLLERQLIEVTEGRHHSYRLTHLGQKVIERGRFAPPIRIRTLIAESVRAA